MSCNDGWDALSVPDLTEELLLISDLAERRTRGKQRAPCLSGGGRLSDSLGNEQSVNMISVYILLAKTLLC